VFLNFVYSLSQYALNPGFHRYHYIPHFTAWSAAYPFWKSDKRVFHRRKYST